METRTGGLPVRRFSSSGDVTMIQVPGMGDSITEGEMGEWLIQEGEAVAVDELVCEIETDKISVEIRAPSNGIVVEHLAKEGETVRVGSDLFKFKASDKAVSGSPPAADAKKEPVKEEAKTAPVKEEAKVDHKVEHKVDTPNKAESTPPVAPAAPSQHVVAGGNREERRVKMKKIRKRIADRLKDSQNTYAMLTTFNEIDMGDLIAMRNQFKDEFEAKKGVKLGFMSPFVKAAANALQDIPAVNAVIDGDDILYRDYVDISVAVASPSGLVVPVLRNVEAMSLADIEGGIADLAGKARDNKLTLEEMAGGTFTISNGGVFGSLMGTPIVNPPQSAILGMHATNPRPVARNGQVVIRPMMYVALTYDHRLIDGREAATFLVSLKKQIENPHRMLLGL